MPLDRETLYPELDKLKNTQYDDEYEWHGDKDYSDGSDWNKYVLFGIICGAGLILYGCVL